MNILYPEYLPYTVPEVFWYFRKFPGSVACRVLSTSTLLTSGTSKPLFFQLPFMSILGFPLCSQGSSIHVCRGPIKLAKQEQKYQLLSSSPAPLTTFFTNGTVLHRDDKWNDQHTSMMEQLVPEIMQHTLSYLDYRSLCNMSMANSVIRRAANDDSAWKALFHKVRECNKDITMKLKC